MEAPFIPSRLELPNPARKSVRLVPETVSKRKERSGIPRLLVEAPQRGGARRWVRPTIPFHPLNAVTISEGRIFYGKLLGAELFLTDGYLIRFSS